MQDLISQYSLALELVQNRIRQLTLKSKTVRGTEYIDMMRRIQILRQEYTDTQMVLHHMIHTYHRKEKTA